MIRHSLLLIAVLVLVGFAAGGALAVTLDEEIDLGKKLDVEIMKQNKLYADDAAQKEMRDYGQKLAKLVGRPQITYHFKILKDDEFNAFSVPGGYVYFTDRLWRTLRKDERIGVVAHEIVHVDKRHGINRVLEQQRRRMWLSVLLMATKAGDLAGNIAGLAEQMYTLKYSREDEEEADTGAVEYCIRAGYNPAGILLAMYKISRFESEAGGAPPKIFSDHPPTKERLAYLKQLLASKGVTPPSGSVQTALGQNKVGNVVSVNGETITFSTTKLLQPGDVIWVMRDGWDFYYEKRSPVPFARGVVTAGGQVATASVKLMPATKQVKLAPNMEVANVPVPALSDSAGLLSTAARSGDRARLSVNGGAKAYDRLLAVQAVWNKDNTQLINDHVGYLVVTNPASVTGYVGRQNPKFAYAPMSAGSPIVRYKDPDQQRWVGPIISLGRGGGTIEVSTIRQLDKSKVYEIVYPPWNTDENYKKRVVAKARFDSAGQKIVLRVSEYTPGWTMEDLENGFDVYEQAKETK